MNHGAFLGSVLSLEREITSFNVKNPKLSRIEPDGDEFASAFAGEVLSARRTDEANGWIGTRGHAGIGRQVSVVGGRPTPENLTVWIDCRDVPPVTLKVENNPGISILVCVGRGDWHWPPINNPV